MAEVASTNLVYVTIKIGGRAYPMPSIVSKMRR
jgi:hypothetical protein